MVAHSGVPTLTDCRTSWWSWLYHLCSICFVLFPTDMILLTCSNKHRLLFAHSLLRGLTLFLPLGEVYQPQNLHVYLWCKGLAPYGLRHQNTTSLHTCLKPEQGKRLNMLFRRICYQNCLSSVHQDIMPHIRQLMVFWSADTQNSGTISFLEACEVNKVWGFLTESAAHTLLQYSVNLIISWIFIF